jgi:hypothetical protein
MVSKGRTDRGGKRRSDRERERERERERGGGGRERGFYWAWRNADGIPSAVAAV